jgi:vanillate O-demethylase monooxygenase subunit
MDIFDIKHPLPIIETNKIGADLFTVTIYHKEYLIWQDGSSYYLAGVECPHRGANLKLGKNCSGKLTCPYHGWEIDGSGSVWSPVDRMDKGTVPTLSLTNKFGLLWVGGDEQYFKELELKNGEFLTSTLFTVKTPLYVVFDNFADGSHIPYIHRRNGPSKKEFEQTKLDWDEQEDHINITYDFAQRRGTLNDLFNKFKKTRWHVKTRIDFNPLNVRYKMHWYEKDVNQPISGYSVNKYYFYPSVKSETKIPCLMFYNVPKLMRPFKFIYAYLVKFFTTDLLSEDLAVMETIILRDPKKVAHKTDTFDAPIIRVRSKLNEFQDFID